jgi:energy-coupling factor transporter ATP-binding protein EcfA2
MEQKNTGKARAFMLTKTADLTDFQTLLKQCESLPDGYTWALMTHDLDEGSIHFHVGLIAPHPLTPSTVANRFDTTPNFVQIWRGATANMWAYLPHNTTTAHDEKADYNHYLDDPTKFATNITDLSPFHYQKGKNNKNANNAKLKKITNQILIGETTLKDLLKPENISFYHDNYNKLNRAIQLRTQSLRYNPPQCRTIYIQGASGTGKSTYAEQMAQNLYPDSVAFASSSNDPLQDYTGEKCLIINDFRPKDYEFNDLLQMLDPTNRKHTHRSRYYNKPLATELIIITTNADLQETINFYTQYTNEDPKQLRRRIQTLITMNADFIPTTELYDEQADGFYLLEPEMM